MNERIMEKATFAGVCKLLENRENDSALRQCTVPLIKLLALVVPGMTFAKPVNPEWFGDILERGITLLDASEHCRGIVDNLGKVLKIKEPDYVIQANNVAMAYVLIVYTAFFDAAKDILPVDGKEIQFDGYAKWAITEKALRAKQVEQVKQIKLTKQSTQNEKTKQLQNELNEPIYPYFLDCELKIPEPAKPIRDVEVNLLEFYGQMTDMLDKHLMGLALVDKLDS